MPRVLIVQRVLPPYRLHFFQKLSQSPHVQTVLAYGQASRASALESISSPDGINRVLMHNHYLCVNGREKIVWQRGLLDLMTSALLDAVIAEFNPRIISNLAALATAQMRGIPFIWWGHGISPRCASTTVRLRLWLVRLADALILYDSVQADRFVALGVPREKVFVAPNSIDTEEIAHLVQERPRSERNGILYIGRLRPAKKVSLLLRGFSLAASHLEPGAKLTIIGDGSERTNLEHLAVQLGVADRVEFTGAIYQQDLLAPWFNSALVSVSPGCVGLSAIHSLAYGVPMIAAQSEPHGPEVAVLKDGMNTLFFPSDNPEELAQRLLNLANDREQWQQMAQAARRTVQERFSLSVMVHAFEQAVQYVQTKGSLS